MARAVQGGDSKFKIFGGVMRRKSDGEGNEVGMELKYCEHCGGLWVRERGTGIVYCDKCQSKVADLPAPRKRRTRLILPVRAHTAVEQYAVEMNEDYARESDARELDAGNLNDRELEAGGAA
jgi:ribosomal protein L37AE/L43A